MPVLVWLALVVAFMILVVLPPLSAAQVMLLLDLFSARTSSTLKPAALQFCGSTSSDLRPS